MPGADELIIAPTAAPVIVPTAILAGARHSNDWTPAISGFTWRATATASAGLRSVLRRRHRRSALAEPLSLGYAALRRRCHPAAASCNHCESGRRMQRRATMPAPSTSCSRATRWRRSRRVSGGHVCSRSRPPTEWSIESNLRGTGATHPLGGRCARICLHRRALLSGRIIIGAAGGAAAAGERDRGGVGRRLGRDRAGLRDRGQCGRGSQSRPGGGDSGERGQDAGRLRQRLHELPGHGQGLGGAEAESSSGTIRTATSIRRRRRRVDF